MKTKLMELYGWYGTIAIILAYTLVSFSLLEADSIWYQLLNATGALGISIVSFHKDNYQPGALNLIWTAIALAAILNMFF